MHILIADDHAVVRRGLREILTDAHPGANFSEAGNGDEVLTRLGKAQISMLVLDINMPGRSGMDVLRDVKHTYPRLPVIILSCQPEDQYAVRCLRAGAAACGVAYGGERGGESLAQHVEAPGRKRGEDASKLEYDAAVADAKEPGERTLRNARGELDRALAGARERLRQDLVVKAFSLARGDAERGMDPAVNERLLSGFVASLEADRG